MEKYYIARQCAEEECAGVVKLTDDEYAAVRKFLDQVYDFSSGYCGSCGIGKNPYETYNDAQESLLRSIYGDYTG